jgi:hypothetical protein
MSLIRLTKTAHLSATRAWARPQVYSYWLSLLSARDYKAIVEALNAKIDKTDVVRAQYLVFEPGNARWEPVYAPIWRAMNDRALAGKFLGLILWEVMYHRPEYWGFHKIDKTIVNEHNLIEDILVMEYFRAKDVPRKGRWRDELAREQQLSHAAAQARAI